LWVFAKALYKASYNLYYKIIPMDEKEKVTLRDYMDRRFDDQQDAVKTALIASTEAIKNVKDDNMKWRDAMNEWRSAMKDREEEFMPRTEAEKVIGILEGRTGKLEESNIKQIGLNTGVTKSWGVTTTIISMVIALVSLAYVFYRAAH
jgi:hypothetical protein